MSMSKIVVAMGFAVAFTHGVANAADQGSGTLTFQGTVVDAPCSIKGDDVNQTIPMGGISTVALDNGTSPVTAFYIHLIGCQLSTEKTVSVTFNGPRDDSTFFSTTGGASNVSLMLLDGNTVIGQDGSTRSVQLAQGDQTLTYGARLVKTHNGESAGAGDFQSVINYTMAYQ